MKALKILVLIKQVPGSNNVEVDPNTGVLKRDGVRSKINPYDLYALESAFSICEKFGGEVYTVTMGPPQARSIILEAICMGAAGGAVISDRAFAGADVLATAYTLSQGIKTLGDFDIIICGKQTTDGDTAQVGAEVAEFLSLPNVANVSKIYGIEDGEIYLGASLDEKNVSLKIKLPCLISVDGDINSPRLPSYKTKCTLDESVVKFISLNELNDKNPENYGLSGSATQVERIFPPEKRAEKSEFFGNADEQSDALFKLISDKKLI